jgi:hypothetical protein
MERRHSIKIGYVHGNALKTYLRRKLYNDIIDYCIYKHIYIYIYHVKRLGD